MAERTVHTRPALIRPIVLACVISLAALVHGSPAATTQAAGTVGALQAISCPVAGWCLAVGNTHAVAWNGASWMIEPAANLPGAGNPLVPDRFDLLGVSCVARDACMAAGQYYADPRTVEPLAEWWDGDHFTFEPVPKPSGASQAALLSVSCASSTFCMAVGTSGSGTLAERWDGASWAMVPAPDLPPGAAGSWLVSVSCTAATACMAVGGYSLAACAPKIPCSGAIADQWNGSAWTLLPAPASSVLQSVSCAAATCTAVGVGNAAGLGVAQRWSGKRWVTEQVPVPALTFPNGSTTKDGNVILNGVSCTGAKRCTAVGYHHCCAAGGWTVTVAEQWNGTRWEPLHSPNPSGDGWHALSAISCASAHRCAAIGTLGMPFSGVPYVERWNGKRWAIQLLP